ncbi:FAD-binding oxidoreductase [Sulfurimonas sp. NW15]|uniref:NAD(P)/FAD-dependent oxidoreductase n=1 Tax=Sulfurimonas sp. NW15 TaxID=2922729 RepID=UPI003DA86001
MYDIAIIGAGINGCSVAYEFIKEGKRVLLLDKEGIASGGSGAAGAFISPKFSKAGELKELLQEAFVYSYDFYDKNFPLTFTKAQLVHIAKEEADDAGLDVYKQSAPLPLQNIPLDLYSQLSAEAKKRESVSIDAGVVDAQKVCSDMSCGATFVQEKAETLVFDDEYWVINESYSAKNVVLATGAYDMLIKEPYIKLRGVWGHRIDVTTTTQNCCSVHQHVSISPSKNGKIAIGATHNVHYHPEKNQEAYNAEQGRAELLKKASQTMQLENVKVIKDYTGLRSGSFDYLPIIGSLVLSSETLLTCKGSLHTKKPDYSEYVYYPNLFMINGSGGYGFVLAPYLAKILTEHILHGKNISERISPARFFARWAKKR